MIRSFFVGLADFCLSALEQYVPHEEDPETHEIRPMQPPTKRSAFDLIFGPYCGLPPDDD